MSLNESWLQNVSSVLMQFTEIKFRRGITNYLKKKSRWIVICNVRVYSFWIALFWFEYF